MYVIAITLTILVATILGLLCGNVPAQAIETMKNHSSFASLDSRLDALESSLYRVNYDKDTAEARIKRIEKLLYGSSKEGDLDPRLKAMEKDLFNPYSASALPEGRKKYAAIPTPPPVITPPADEAAAASSNNTPPDGITSGASESEAKSADTADSTTAPGGTQIEPVIAPKQVAYKVSDKPSSSLNPTGVPNGQVLKLNLHKDMFVDQTYEPREKISQLTRVLRQDPLDCLIPDLYFERAKANIALNQYRKALDDLNEAIRNSPMRSELYLARGWVHKMLGDDFLARSDVSRARFTNPTLPPNIEFDVNTQAKTSSR